MSNATAEPLATSTRADALPRVNGLIALRAVRDAFHRGNFERFRRLAERHPEGFSITTPFSRVHLVFAPDLIEALLVKNHRYYHRDRAAFGLKRVMGNGILTSEDEFHLKQRRLVQPAFHKGRIEAYAATMSQYAELQSAMWKAGETTDISRDMMAVTLQVIARTMFGFDAAQDVDTVEHCMNRLLPHVDRYVVPGLGHVLDRLPLKSTREINDSIEKLDALIYRVIDEHRASGIDNGDLLTMLLNARYDDGTAMPDTQVRDEALTLFLAGHETTANTLTWAFYQLSKNPEIEKRLHEEVDSVLADGRPATAADLTRLDYTRRVMAEAMRIHPTVPAFARQALEDHQLAHLKIRKGDVVAISQMVVHNDPQWYPNPERFDPDRWLPEAAAARPKFAYFPFGAGPRKCIGEPFAWMEGTLLLATFARDWRFALSPTARVQQQPAITLRAKHGMPMVPHSRRS